MTKRERLGAQGEMLAIRALLGMGYHVFKEVSGTGHPDLCARAPGNPTPVSVEVRTESLCGQGDTTRRERKSYDQCNHYAWVNRKTGSVTFEPMLPALN